MNISSIQTIEVEWHQLDLRYQDLRMSTAQTQQQLMLSIHQHGLLVPVVVVTSHGQEKPWVLIDGYLRANATKALAKDVIRAQVWELSIAEALLHAYRNHKARPWCYLEEAQLLQELICCHQYSQAQLARCLGKSETWVSHRLQFITALPQFIKEAIYQGHLSFWPASRILIPFARANQSHAKKLMDYLACHSHANREIQAFYQHYLRSNKKVREHLVEYPRLFFESLALSKQPFPSKQFSPEAIWEKKLAQIAQWLDELSSILPAVFYPQQNDHDRTVLKSQLHQVTLTMDALQQSLQRRIHAQTTAKTDGTTLISNRQKQPRDPSALKNLAS